MLLSSSPLAEIAASLRSGERNLLAYINEICDRIDTVEPLIHALMPEAQRRERLLAGAIALQTSFPHPEHRPPLYGILVGVKDIFRVDGFPTTAGSQLPSELFAGPEAASVRSLRAAGVLILGKTVSTEFAYFEPGPTRNPHNLNHTPGGSSSGSAAAVAAGFCPLALGTQTIGSTIRPAAFCGIVGFKPSYGRISTDGLIKFSESVDTIGFFTQDVPGIALAASLLCTGWRSLEPASRKNLPVLGVPDGPYLAQASSEGLAAFEVQLRLLEQAGYTVQHVAVMKNIEEINSQHMRMAFAELASVHTDWFARYASLYRPKTAAAIQEGQAVGPEELETARAERLMLRDELESLMQQEDIDIWVSPAAPGTAPAEISTTGNSIMNLPWTYAGMPAIALPAGNAENGLPLGLQCVGRFMDDERLIAWAEPLEEILRTI